MYSIGFIETLITSPCVISSKDADVKPLLGRVGGDRNVKSEHQCPVCAGPFSMETTTLVIDEKETSELITRVRMTSTKFEKDWKFLKCWNF